jgi:outer membrane protein TolC
MFRSLRLLALAAAVAALPALRAQSYDTTTLPLPETYFPALKGILGAAVTQSPRMIARNAENAASEGNRVTMRSGQLPSINGYFNYYPWDRQVRADISGATDASKLSYNFSLYQPIYHWGALQNNTRMGELQLHMTQGQTAEGYRLLAQEIRAQYMQLVIKKAALGRIRLSQHVAEDNMAVSRTKLEKKVISEAEMGGIVLKADQARLAADQAEVDYSDSKAVFAKLCGAPVLGDDQIPEEFPVVTLTETPALDPLVTAFTSQKELNSYNLAVVRDQIAVEKLTYANIQTRLRPQLNAVVGTSQDQISYTTNLAAKYKVNEYFVGLQVSWSIFDGFAARGAAATSMAHRRQLEQSYRDLSADLSDQARALLKQLTFARRGMEIANRLLDSSAGSLHDKKSDAARGLASDADVNTYQLAYEEARINAFTARSDYLMKNGEFLSTLLQDPALANLPAKP